VKRLVETFLRKLRGDLVNIDVKKLKGSGKAISESGREGSE